jgi:hypothetical protein
VNLDGDGDGDVDVSPGARSSSLRAARHTLAAVGRRPVIHVAVAVAVHVHVGERRVRSIGSSPYSPDPSSSLRK